MNQATMKSLGIERLTLAAGPLGVTYHWKSTDGRSGYGEALNTELALADIEAEASAQPCGNVCATCPGHDTCHDEEDGDVDPAEVGAWLNGEHPAIERRSLDDATAEEWAQAANWWRQQLAEKPDETPTIEGTDEANRGFKEKLDAWRRQGVPVYLSRKFRAGA